MISQISGILIKKQPPHVMIDVKGIGFEIEVPMSTYYGLPKIGAHGNPVIFLHPKDFNGTLIELEEVKG